ncbi:MAG: hypothetical protein ABSB84_15160 [Verrucomicrobiota bacterium]|jgi:hypothetical protein
MKVIDAINNYTISELLPRFPVGFVDVVAARRPFKLRPAQILRRDNAH